MNSLQGTWIAPEFLSGALDSGRFIKFQEDLTYIVNDGLDQAEATYKIENKNLILEPALGVSNSSLTFQFEIKSINGNSVLMLLKEKEGITYSFVKKAG